MEFQAAPPQRSITTDFFQVVPDRPNPNVGPRKGVEGEIKHPHRTSSAWVAIHTAKLK
jgi:hypothetical protein